MAQDIAEPFKVGTFEIAGSPTVGIVLRDSLIVELDAANATLEKTGRYPAVPMPADMLELIERYDYGLKRRLYEIVNDHVENDRMGVDRAAYVHDVDSVTTLPPIMYPGKILNAAVNFYSHVEESGTDDERREARRLRRDYHARPGDKGATPTRGHGARDVPVVGRDEPQILRRFVEAPGGHLVNGAVRLKLADGLNREDCAHVVCESGIGQLCDGGLPG